MALQASLNQLPSALSAIGPDAWVTLPALLSSPLSTLRRHRLSRLRSEGGDVGTARQTHSTSKSRINEVKTPSSKTLLPEFLTLIPTTSLQSGSLFLTSTQPLPWLPGGLRTPLMAGQTPLAFLRRALSTSAPKMTPLGGATLGATHHAAAPRRRLGLMTSFSGRQLPSHRKMGGFKEQSRHFSSTFQPASSNMLAHAERTANNNPTSASAQNAFYAALLRSNMPKIVIERYQSGRYATNPAVDASYLKALQITGSVPAPGSNAAAAPGGSVSPETLQAVGHAVAGQNYGGHLVVPGNKSGTGAKEAPLYVVVEESWSAMILKWVKTFLWVGLAGYFLLVILTMVVEFTGSLRTRTGQNNEVQPQHQTVRFSDVHGCDEAKEELQELVEFLTNPDKFNQLGGKLPKGILLVGPPGTGKTMLARAVAGEAGVPVFYMSGSEFDELYVGVGAKRVRDLFAQARNKSPSIIFIDELDAVGGKRNARDPAYAKQTLNQLLTELDGFSPSTGVILIAATNYPESLDKALTRPGRFDRHINVPLPDVRGRIEILKHHMMKMPIAGDVDVTSLARATSGMSGADLENLCNQAAVNASRLKYKKINGQNFEWAKDKILMGAESRSRVIREKDKIQTAYHEAGHALVGLFTPSASQLYKATIMPRGRALGVTHYLPEMDAVSMGYDQFLAQIDTSMGGRAAEELIYGPNKVTSGISGDVQNATRIAYHLVTECGYSNKLGNVDLRSTYDSLSSETKQEIEREVRDIVESGRKRADRIVKDKRKELELLKDALLEFETLSYEEILKVIQGEKLKRLEVELRENESDKGNNGNNTPPKKDKDIGPKGGVGIKLPDVLLAPGATGRRPGEKESARVSER